MSVSISGDTIVVGASRNDDDGIDSGSAYVFERNAGGANGWGEVAKTKEKATAQCRELRTAGIPCAVMKN